MLKTQNVCNWCKKIHDTDTMKLDHYYDYYTCEDCGNPNDLVCQECFAKHTDYPDIKEYKNSGHQKDCSYRR